MELGGITIKRSETVKAVKEEVRGNLVCWLFLFDILKSRNSCSLSFFLVDQPRGLSTLLIFLRKKITVLVSLIFYIDFLFSI